MAARETALKERVFIKAASRDDLHDQVDDLIWRNRCRTMALVVDSLSAEDLDKAPLHGR